MTKKCSTVDPSGMEPDVDEGIRASLESLDSALRTRQEKYSESSVSPAEAEKTLKELEKGIPRLVASAKNPSETRANVEALVMDLRGTPREELLHRYADLIAERIRRSRRKDMTPATALREMMRKGIYTIRAHQDLFSQGIFERVSALRKSSSINKAVRFPTAQKIFEKLNGEFQRAFLKRADVTEPIQINSAECRTRIKKVLDLVTARIAQGKSPANEAFIQGRVAGHNWAISINRKQETAPRIAAREKAKAIKREEHKKAEANWQRRERQALEELRKYRKSLDEGKRSQVATTRKVDAIILRLEGKTDAEIITELKIHGGDTAKNRNRVQQWRRRGRKHLDGVPEISESTLTFLQEEKRRGKPGSSAQTSTERA